MNKELLKGIESFGDIFKQKYRDEWDKDKLLNDWKYSLKFFFGQSFMRGRKDKISDDFKNKTIKVLEKTFFTDSNFSLDKIKEELEKKENGVNNKGDRIMVLDTLKFIKQLPDYNITTYIIRKLKENEQQAYDELDNINYIGDKIATLYLRELCWMFDIKPKDYTLIFPIDTWVRQIINRLKILNNRELSLTELKKVKESEIKRKAIDICLKNEINPLKFNAGVWYIGTHSLEIVLDNLERLKFSV